MAIYMFYVISYMFSDMCVIQCMYLCDCLVCLWYMYFVWARLFSACYANFVLLSWQFWIHTKWLNVNQDENFSPIQNLPKIIREFLIDFISFVCFELIFLFVWLLFLLFLGLFFGLFWLILIKGNILIKWMII